MCSTFNNIANKLRLILPNNLTGTIYREWIFGSSSENFFFFFFNLSDWRWSWRRKTGASWVAAARGRWCSSRVRETCLYWSLRANLCRSASAPGFPRTHVRITRALSPSNNFQFLFSCPEKSLDFYGNSTVPLGSKHLVNPSSGWGLDWSHMMMWSHDSPKFKEH